MLSSHVCADAGGRLGGGGLGGAGEVCRLVWRGVAVLEAWESLWGLSWDSGSPSKGKRRELICAVSRGRTWIHKEVNPVGAE